MSKYQVGDLVRVGRSCQRSGAPIKFGRVLEVVSTGNLGSILLRDPNYYDRVVAWWVWPDAAKLAKQAMRKRAQYAARRGGPFEIPHSVQ